MRLAVLVALLLEGCKPSSTPTQDAGDADVWVQILSDGGVVVADPATACANLAKVGCAEGSNPLCEKALSQAPSLGHTTLLAVSCVAAAKTRDEARRCDPSYFCK